MLFVVQSLSCVRLFTISGTAACQAPLSVGFPRQEYWSGLLFPSPVFNPNYSSADKESACHARDPGSIPRSGRSPGEGISYPLQYSWASLVAQLVKNPPTMQETWIQSLGWEDFLEKGTATHSSILNWRTSWTVYTWGSKESDTTEQLSQVRYRI